MKPSISIAPALLGLPLAVLMLVSGSFSISQPMAAKPAKVKLGLNDVAIHIPYQSLPGLMKSAPHLLDHPNPDLFAQGADALPLDGESFVPAWALKEINAILVDDGKIREGEEFGSRGFRTEIEARFTSPQDGIALDYRMASLRVDPCANRLAVKSNKVECRHEVRLVWQVFQIDDESVFGRDNNIHAIHELDTPTFMRFVAGLRSIREEAGIAPAQEMLGPHPEMIKQGIDGQYFKGIVALVHRYVRASNLKRVAFLADTNAAQQGHWPMLAFDVLDGKPLRSNDRTLKIQEGESPKMMQRVNGDHAALGTPEPRGLNVPDMFPEYQDGMDYLQDLKFKTPLIANAALKIDNPLLHDTANTDCLSCHMSQGLRVNTLEDAKRNNIAVRLSQKPYASKTWNIKNADPSRVEGTSLQIFSFFNGDVRIAPRVINEAALSADEIQDY